MEYTKFEIINFKGIKDLTVDFTKKPTGNIFPLVGLNESGKTTILEAIHFFQDSLEDGKEHTLIHKRDKGGFSGIISVRATLKFNASDKEYINDFISKAGFQLKSPVNFVIISKEYNFTDSVFVKNVNTWSFHLENQEWGLLVKTKQAKKYIGFHAKDNVTWNKLVTDIKQKLLPKILYFPDFIFKFPEKIYLTKNDNPSYFGEEQDRQEEYGLIVEDILKSINDDYSATSLSDKLDSGNEGSKESAEQILREMSTKLNSQILTKWKHIFKKSPVKTVAIQHDKDNEGFYLEFSIEEGGAVFKIDERSLGFRWFFGFILFTRFRQIREGDKETLFLFDEPANNLHQASQQKLLTLFNEISKQSKVIYSTHSHYLLSSKLTLNTLIVNDKGREIEEDYDYRQEIKATPYREFCSNSKNETTHFQPILDVLEYVENPFEQNNNIVFFEGKCDYYTFKWIYNTCLKLGYDFNFYPGSGVDKYENIFREYVAHNRNFIAIFDADSAGKNAKRRYIQDITQELEKQVFTLEDINPDFSGFTTEKLFTQNERLGIQKISFSDSTEYEKGKFNTAVQELFIKKEVFELSGKTKDHFSQIFKFIKGQLENG